MRATRCREEQNILWHGTNPNEIRVFLAVTLLQSIVGQKILYCIRLFFNCMTGKRFERIKQYLHFSNNNDFDPNNPCPKLNKIWDVYENLNNKFKILITPEKLVTIDESLLLYKGRLGWVQYIPLKRARFGIKTYLLCESKTGYVYSFIIYTGKGTALGIRRSSCILPDSRDVDETTIEQGLLSYDGQFL